jgi:hypothetical protein
LIVLLSKTPDVVRFQAQVPHIIASFHSRTPTEYHVPEDARTIFWTINVLLLVVPHILALRCWLSPLFFAAETGGNSEASTAVASAVRSSKAGDKEPVRKNRKKD